MRRLQTFGLTIALMLAAAGAARSAPPPNDDCANATPITTFPFRALLDTTEATQDPGQGPTCNEGGGPTIWFSVTPSFAGRVCVHTCGQSTYYAAVAAFGGTCGANGPSLACDQQYCQRGSRIRVDVTPGQTRLVEIAMQYAFGQSVPGGPIEVTIAREGADDDGDGVEDCSDNCLLEANATQADVDQDDVGDVCDVCPHDPNIDDADGDGVCLLCNGTCDNCPFGRNADQADADGDGTGDVCDNCPVANPDQHDVDYDGRGDVCDACPLDPTFVDYDLDGHCSDPAVCPAGCDDCPYDADPDQHDADGDGIGDVCDDCPQIANPHQEDGDYDGIGDACDPCAADQSSSDYDQDGYCSNPTSCPAGCDDCPYDTNPDQIDTDGDGRGDACDNCPFDANPNQRDGDYDDIGDACDPCPADDTRADYDGDGHCTDPAVCPAGCDNCPYTANAAQTDSDGDGIGDACDNCPNTADPSQSDWDGDGLGNACDPCTVCNYSACGEYCYDMTTFDCEVRNPAPDGTACDDSNVCTTNERCQAGYCISDPLVCPDPGPCAEPTTCNRAVGGCVPVPRPNGMTCDDGDRCTANDACTMGRCLGTPVDACPVDQYKCYRSSGGKPNADTVEYADAFGTTRVDRQTASYMCNAATDAAPTFDDQRHLTCWRTRQTSSTPRRTLTLRDRFGAGDFTLSKPSGYCAPSEELAAPASSEVDEYACYRARGPKRTAVSLTLGDQFETRGTSVLQPYSVCLPASRNGTPLVDATAHLVCYKLREARTPAFAAHNLTLSSPMGGEALRAGRRRLLCVPATAEPCARLTSVTGGGTTECGGPQFNPAPAAPFAGQLYDAAAGGNVVWNLGNGCTYFGGGNSTIYPSKQQVVGTTLTLDAHSCEGDTLAFVASHQAGPGQCAFGPADDTICLNASHVACTSDTDCGSVAGSCAPIPRCFAAPPEPFVNSLASVCIMTPLAADTTASVTPATGAYALTSSVRTLVYLTSFGVNPHPCPRCINAVCDGGQRGGRPCIVGPTPEGTSLDCPPNDSTFFLSIGPASATSTTAAKALPSNAAGLFCPGQTHPGAFGIPAVRRIEMTGTPAGDLRDGAPHQATLLDLACIQSTGNPGADQVADFPGPQATSQAGTIQLTQ